MIMRRNKSIIYCICAFGVVFVLRYYGPRIAFADDVTRRSHDISNAISPPTKVNKSVVPTAYKTLRRDRDTNIISQSLKYLTERILDNGNFRKDTELLPKCKSEKKNFVYIKNHKCGSDTMAATFRRFSYKRNLSMVLPVKSMYNIGWPHQLRPSLHRPSKTGGFNILCDHTVYNETYFKKIMPADSAYITSIRQPFARMKSAFFFFGVDKISNISLETREGNKKLEIFLKNPQMYDDRFKAPHPRVNRPCVPDGLSVLRNAMTFDLGFPIGYHDNTVDEQLDLESIQQWLENIDRTFDMVLLVDHFMESAIMLKRTMCWNFKDMIFKRYSPLNPSRKIHPRSFPISLIDGYNMWSFVDYVLYEHFRRVLWRKMNLMGLADFMDEVTEFKDTLEKTLDFCDKGMTERKEIQFAATKWNAAFVVNRKDCELINSDMRQEVKDQYDAIPVKVKQPRGFLKGC